MKEETIKIRQNFAILGESMKRVIKAVVFLIVFVLMAIVLTLMIESLSYSSDEYGSIGYVNYDLTSWIIFLIIVGSVIVLSILIYYIKFVINLGYCARLTRDPRLEKAYRGYLWGIIIVLMVFGVFSIYPYLIMPVADSVSNSTLSSIGISGYSIAFLLAMLITIVYVSQIFNIVGVNAFAKWNSAYTQTNNLSITNMKLNDSMNMLRYSTIFLIIPWVNYIAMITILVGFYRYGDSLVKEFNEVIPQNLNINYSSHPISTPLPPSPTPNSTSIQAPPVVSPVVKPAPAVVVNRTAVRFCWNCGENLQSLEQQARFCPRCGKSILQ